MISSHNQRRCWRKGYLPALGQDLRSCKLAVQTSVAPHSAKCLCPCYLRQDLSQAMRMRLYPFTGMRSSSKPGTSYSTQVMATYPAFFCTQEPASYGNCLSSRVSTQSSYSLQPEHPAGAHLRSLVRIEAASKEQTTGIANKLRICKSSGGSVIHFQAVQRPKDLPTPRASCLSS